MRKKTIKIRQHNLNGNKVNSTQISKLSKDYFATGDSHNNVKIYLINSEEELMCLNSNTNNNVQTEVSTVSFSADQEQIFSGSNRGIINVWDMQSGKAICTLKGHATSVNTFGIFPDQIDKLASGSYDTFIKLWDTRSKNNTGTLKHHTKQINSIDISPDGRMLLSGSEDTTAKLWDLRYPQRLLTTYSEHTAPILKVKFNPEDCMFASCSMDRTSKYFRCEQNHYNFISTTDVVSTAITSVEFSPDGRLLYTAANDLLKVWNMGKNGLLVEQIEAGWRNVGDLAWVDGGLVGIGWEKGYLAVWACNIGKGNKNNIQELRQESDQKRPKILPNISQNPIQRNAGSRQGSRNVKNNHQDMREALQNINYAVDVVKKLQVKRQNNPNLHSNPSNPSISSTQIEQRRRNIDPDKAKLADLSRQKHKQLSKERQKQIQKQRELQRQRQVEKQRQKELRIKIEKQLRQQQQKQQGKIQEQQRIRLQELAQQRQQRQQALGNKLVETLEENANGENLENTLQVDMLQHSSLMNISAFMGDGVQKQKLRQIEMIGQITKDNGRFETVLTERIQRIKPIIFFWKQGKIKEAFNAINRQEKVDIISDCLTTIINTPHFKSKITPQIACALIKKLTSLMQNKHSTYVKGSMLCLNEVVLMFKEELIKVKTFNPMTRVDLSREQRLAKYDLLLEQFLNVFKQDRLKRYANVKKFSSENEELCKIAHELYSNLQEILRKIMPKKQPEPA